MIKQSTHTIQRLLCSVPLLMLCGFVIYGIFAAPDKATQCVAQSLNMCLVSLVPSLFPFMVVTNIMADSRYCSTLGLLFYPLARLLGIRSRSAGVCLLAGILGGSAAGSASVNTMVQSRSITARQAEVLLCCVSGFGPSFIIGAVGGGMYGNLYTGVCLYAANLLATILCCIPFRLFLLRNESAAALTGTPLPNCTTLVDGILFATKNIAILCGFVVFFRCAAENFIAPNAGKLQRFFAYGLFEATTACADSVQLDGPYRIYLCCAACSFTGICAILQMQALAPKQASFAPVVLFRFLHLPVSLGLLALLLRFIPSAIPTGTFAYDKMHVFTRLPVDAMAAFFLLLLCVLYALEKQGRLLFHRKQV